MSAPITNQPNLPDFQPHEQTTWSTTFAGKPAQVGSAVIVLTQCARRLEQRGFFAANSCADQATNADMARMRHALRQLQ